MQRIFITRDLRMLYPLKPVAALDNLMRPFKQTANTQQKYLDNSEICTKPKIVKRPYRICCSFRDFFFAAYS